MTVGSLIWQVASLTSSRAIKVRRVYGCSRVCEDRGVLAVEATP